MAGYRRCVSTIAHLASHVGEHVTGVRLDTQRETATVQDDGCGAAAVVPTDVGFDCIFEKGTNAVQKY